MNIDLKQALKNYLTVRRALGYKLDDTGRQLVDFVAHLERAGAKTVTTALAVSWAKLPNSHAAWWASRLSMVRGFASYLQTIDPDTEIPPADLLPWISRRATPYLYSDEQIRLLMAAARTIRSPLGASTYETLFGLMAVTGLRVNETICLDRDDVDFEAGVLIVRQGKFGKSRELVLQPTTAGALKTYALRRNQMFPRPVHPSFFISQIGTRLHYSNIQFTFQRLAREAGLHRRSPNCRPRIHDLRHSFAVRTLLEWYRDGGDVQARLPLLSTYLGHVDPTSTYWYLSAAPELMALVAKRLETALGEMP